MAVEVLIDQTTKVFQTNWNGEPAWEGQIWKPTAGEIWRITAISGFGGGVQWDVGNGSCSVGICASTSDWNPNNGYNLMTIAVAGCTSNPDGDNVQKHEFDLTHSSGDYPEGLICYGDHLYFFYFRCNAATQCFASKDYNPLAICKGIDSANSGGTWNSPASWLGPSDSSDLMFEMKGEKVTFGGGGGGAQHMTNPQWSM